METKQTLHNFLVNRDGQLDTEWLDNLEREQKREALAHLGHLVISYPAVVGKNILNALSKLPEHVNQY